MTKFHQSDLASFMEAWGIRDSKRAQRLLQQALDYVEVLVDQLMWEKPLGRESPSSKGRVENPITSRDVKAAPTFHDA